MRSYRTRKEFGAVEDRRVISNNRAGLPRIPDTRRNALNSKVSGFRELNPRRRRAINRTALARVRLSRLRGWYTSTRRETKRENTKHTAGECIPILFGKLLLVIFLLCKIYFCYTNIYSTFYIKYLCTRRIFICKFELEVWKIVIFLHESEITLSTFYIFSFIELWRQKGEFFNLHFYN